MKHTKTKEERCAYVRGALGACEALRVSLDMTAAVCKDLQITQVDLKEVGEECKEHGKVDNHVPQVQG